MLLLGELHDLGQTEPSGTHETNLLDLERET